MIIYYTKHLTLTHAYVDEDSTSVEHEHASFDTLIPNSDTNVSDEKMKQICFNLLTKMHAGDRDSIQLKDGERLWDCSNVNGKWLLDDVEGREFVIPYLSK